MQVLSLLVCHMGNHRKANNLNLNNTDDRRRSATRLSLARGFQQPALDCTNLRGARFGATSAGSINSSNGLWTAPAVAGQVVRITANDGTLTVFRDVAVLEVFPFDDPQLPLSWDRDKTVIVSRAEDRSRASRVKDKDNLPFETFQFALRDQFLF